MPAKDIESARASRRKWYYNNKDKQYSYKLKREHELTLWMRSLKTKCSRCPETFWACLEFHHLNPDKKDIALAQVIKRGWSKERIIREIEKCEILCSNCHRKEHHQAR